MYFSFFPTFQLQECFNCLYTFIFSLFFVFSLSLVCFWFYSFLSYSRLFYTFPISFDSVFVFSFLSFSLGFFLLSTSLFLFVFSTLSLFQSSTLINHPFHQKNCPSSVWPYKNKEFPFFSCLGQNLDH